MISRRDLTKGQQRELCRIIGLAYERELEAALADLAEQFRSWQAREIGPHQLSDAIHAFHEGPGRDLWVRYNGGHVELAAQLAVHRGIVAEHEIASNVLELLRRWFPT